MLMFSIPLNPDILGVPVSEGQYAVAQWLVHQSQQMESSSRGRRRAGAGYWVKAVAEEYSPHLYEKTLTHEPRRLADRLQITEACTVNGRLRRDALQRAMRTIWDGDETADEPFDHDVRTALGANRTSSVQFIESREQSGLVKLGGGSKWAIGDCLELVHSWRGWAANEVAFSVGGNLSLSGELESLLPTALEATRAELAAQGQPIGVNRKKFCLTRLRPPLTDENGGVTMEAATTDYYTVISLNRRWLTIENEFPRVFDGAFDLPGWRDARIPNQITCHVVGHTRDDKFLVGQRSRHVLWYPETWSLSFEEQMHVGPEPRVVRDDNERVVRIFEPDRDPVDTIVRGAFEELRVELKREDVRINMICAEGDSLGVAVLAYAEIPLVSEEVEARWNERAHDQYEFERLAFIDARLSGFPTLYSYMTRGELGGVGQLHPSTPMRALIAAIRRHGFHRARAHISWEAIKAGHVRFGRA